jgi:hypothetical protein
MTSPELERLADGGSLHREPPIPEELAGLIASGERLLTDAGNDSLSLESRFHLAYDAAHALSLAALRRAGYRSSHRYVVFQCLAHTLGAPPATWRLLASAHQRRNRAQYEGVFAVSERLVGEIIAAANAILTALRTASAQG